jgi:transposase
MAKPQPSYSKEFKQEAVRLVETSGKGKSAIARDLGISDSALCKWCKEFGMHGEQAFPGKGHQTALEEEVRRLQKENEILRTDQGYPKKSSTHLCAAPAMKYAFIAAHEKEFPVLRMCQVRCACRKVAMMPGASGNQASENESMKN